MCRERHINVLEPPRFETRFKVFDLQSFYLLEFALPPRRSTDLTLIHKFLVTLHHAALLILSLPKKKLQWFFPNNPPPYRASPHLCQ